MKNRHPVHPSEVKRAEEPHEKPHLRLLKQPPAVKSERQRQEEDELRSLIKTLQRRVRGVKDAAVYPKRCRRDYCGLLIPEDDLPPAA
jgi:hypothetical protein